MKERGRSVLEVRGNDQYGDTFRITLHDDRIEVSSPDAGKDVAWALQLHAAPGTELPFTDVGGKSANAVFRGHSYSVTCSEGRFEKAAEGDSHVLRIIPDNGKITIDCALRQSR